MKAEMALLVDSKASDDPKKICTTTTTTSRLNKKVEPATTVYRWTKSSQTCFSFSSKSLFKFMQFGIDNNLMCCQFLNAPICQTLRKITIL
jgi:hypothetical protein